MPLAATPLHSSSAAMAAHTVGGTYMQAQTDRLFIPVLPQWRHILSEARAGRQANR
jgi:hypothetical protein